MTLKDLQRAQDLYDSRHIDDNVLQLRIQQRSKHRILRLHWQKSWLLKVDWRSLAAKGQDEKGRFAMH